MRVRDRVRARRRAMRALVLRLWCVIAVCASLLFLMHCVAG
jgi:hypothetical protein